MQLPTTIRNHQQLSAKTYNYSKSCITTRNVPQQSTTPTTTRNHLQTPKKPKLVTHIYFDSNKSIITEYIFDNDTDAAKSKAEATQRCLLK